MDIAAQTGTPVMAPADGVVIKAGFGTGYGNMVELSHGYGIRTLFAHNSRLNVKAGQRVKRGEVISYVGDSGSSTVYSSSLRGTAQWVAGQPCPLS